MLYEVTRQLDNKQEGIGSSAHVLGDDSENDFHKLNLLKTCKIMDDPTLPKPKVILLCLNLVQENEREMLVTFCS